MKIPRFAVALLPTLAFTLVQPSFAQTEALLRAPVPSANESTSSLPNDPAFSSNSALPAFAPGGYYPVQRAPQPIEIKPKLRMLDWSLIGAASMLRVLDYTSTEKALADPQHFQEAMLPTALVENKPAFAAFEAATVGVNYTAYRLLVRHHMRSLARIAQYAYVGGMAFTVTRNYQALGSVPAQP
ncbi:MAG: hypothetical protein WBW84_18390 [Acidobacteriaceae bacterium]